MTATRYGSHRTTASLTSLQGASDGRVILLATLLNAVPLVPTPGRGSFGGPGSSGPARSAGARLLPFWSMIALAPPIFRGPPRARVSKKKRGVLPLSSRAPVPLACNVGRAPQNVVEIFHAAVRHREGGPGGREEEVEGREGGFGG